MCLPPTYLSRSLSPCAMHKWACVYKWGAPLSYLYSFVHLTFYSTMSAPLNLTRPNFLGRLKTSYYYIPEGANDLTYSGGVFLMTLYWPSTILVILPKGTSRYNEIQIILLIGTLGYSKWIHFKVTIFQQKIMGWNECLESLGNNYQDLKIVFLLL